MKIINNIKSFKIFVLLAIISVACNNNWEEHYAESSYDLPAYNIYEYLTSNSSLSTFVKMIDQSGYDQFLKSSQTYTVWAPTNDALKDIDLSDSVLVMQIVQTHITRNRYSTSGIGLKGINVSSGKYVSFGTEASDYLFGEVPLVESNINTSNGLVHLLNGYVPYLKNIWEYIHSEDGFDSLYNFLLANGKPDYDSVFVEENEVINQLGSFDSEDSIYTVILPTNTAWNEAYDRITPYYVFPDTLGGAERQHQETQFTIIKDFAYRELITDPSSYTKLTSTTNTVYSNPAYLFEGASYTELSNGAVFVTEKMPFADTLSWFKKIQIEAEQKLNRENSNSNVYVRSSEGTSYETSNNSYIYVESNSTSDLAAPKVEFALPDILSATYKIYCVFVPNTIVDENDLRPMKPKFKLNYISTRSGRISRKTLRPEIDETSPTEVTKMYLGEFTFDFANVADEKYPYASTSIVVESNVKISETGEYSRDMRIDCIILEPSLQ